MPRSFDPIGARLPVSHNALERISPIPPRLDLPSLEELIDQWGQAFEKYGIPAIKELTGIDLSGVAGMLDAIKDAIHLDLSALAELNPVVFLQRIADALQGIDLSGGPGAVLEAIGDAVADLPAIRDALQVISVLFDGIDFSVSHAPQEVWEAVVSAFIRPLNTFAELIGGLLPAGVIPDITADMSSDMQGTIDALLNAAKNTPGAVGQAVSALEAAWTKLPTTIFNKLGGGAVVPRASQQMAADAIEALAQTLSDQASAISTLQNQLGSTDGFSAQVTFPTSTISRYQAAGAFTTPLPSWWKYGEYILGGGGGGGKGMAIFDVWGKGGDAGLWLAGNFEKDVDIPSSTTQLTGNVGAPGTGGAGGGGMGGDGGNTTLSAVGGTFGTKTAIGGEGGKVGDAGSVAGKAPGNSPTTDTGEYIVGGAQQNSGSANGNAPAGGGAGAQFSGSIGGTGARGEAMVKLIAGLPAEFTDTVVTKNFFGGAAAKCYRLNTGIAKTDSMTASCIWNAYPRAGAMGSHVAIIRADASFQNFVYFAVTGNGAGVTWCMGRVTGGGLPSVWDSGSLDTTSLPFIAFSLQSNSERTFSVLANGTPFKSYNDGAASSAMGPDYRYGGWASSDYGKYKAITNFAFLDTGTPSRISSSTVATSQTTTSAAYVDLATPGPAVTVIVPPSGEVKVDLSVWANHSAAGQNLYASVALSGANTLVANDSNAVQMRQMAISPGNLMGTLSKPLHMKGLNPGTTTFTMKYRTTAATATFADRQLIVDPKP